MRLAALLAAGKACLEEVQSVGNVSPPETDADVVWLVVHRAREEQDADFGQPRAVPGEVIDPRDARESDRACRRAYPLKGFGVPVEESIQEGQVMAHDSEVAIEKGMAVPECERGKEFARRARADGCVVLQRADCLPEGVIVAGDPADPQPRQAVALGDAAQRNRSGVKSQAAGSRSAGSCSSSR